MEKANQEGEGREKCENVMDIIMSTVARASYSSTT